MMILKENDPFIQMISKPVTYQFLKEWIMLGMATTEMTDESLDQVVDKFTILLNKHNSQSAETQTPVIPVSLAITSMDRVDALRLLGIADNASHDEIEGAFVSKQRAIVNAAQNDDDDLEGNDALRQLQEAHDLLLAENANRQFELNRLQVVPYVAPQKSLQDIYAEMKRILKELFEPTKATNSEFEYKFKTAQSYASFFEAYTGEQATSSAQNVDPELSPAELAVIDRRFKALLDITGLHDKYLAFEYQGRHQELGDKFSMLKQLALTPDALQQPDMVRRVLQDEGQNLDETFCSL